MFRDWFTLGGFVAKEEDEGTIETAHASFCGQWGITYPLHSYDIRSETENFTWLSALSEREYNKFMSGLGNMLLSIPVIGHACVVDRPGYNKRYREKYGRQTWMLCRTAFTVVVERAAKHARKSGCKLRVYVEEGDETADNMIRGYYKELRTPDDGGDDLFFHVNSLHDGIDVVHEGQRVRYETQPSRRKEGQFEAVAVEVV
jgi:cold shock CspA family protein